MRATVYARFSTDLQSACSIEDQIGFAPIKAEGWSLIATYTDHAISGASRLRPGFQKLLQGARRRLRRRRRRSARPAVARPGGHRRALQAAGLRRRASVTLAEGEISELHVGLKGTMNALFLKDLAMKTRRGLEGRVRQGRSGGGLCYGYEVVRRERRRGQPDPRRPADRRRAKPTSCGASSASTPPGVSPAQIAAG